MIEVLALASAVSTISSSISNSIKAGKDISSVIPAFGKLARLEADINLAESGRHKGPLGRLTSSEEEGFAIAQAKFKHKEAMDELRSVCRLYGPAGMWESVVFEQAQARKRRKDVLEAHSKKRDRIFYGLTIALCISVAVVGSLGLVWIAAILAEEIK